MEPGRKSQTGYTIELECPVRVDDFHAKQEFEVPPIVFEHGIQSGMSVPMRRDGEIVGAMLVHTRSARHFSEEEAILLQLLANQTAMAIRNVQRFEDLKIINRKLWRKTAQLRAVHEASKAITASFGLDQKQVLDQIARHAVECIKDVEFPKAEFGTIQLFNQETNELVFQSIYPGDEYSKIVKKVGERRSLDAKRASGSRIGITGRANLLGQSQLVPDVRLDPDYIEFNADTLSELSVPLKYGEEILGDLNVESNQVAGLDEDDQTALEALAEHAVIAIKNTQQYQELKETKGSVGARTALAWMGMVSSIWWHRVTSTVADIRNRVETIRKSNEQSSVGKNLPDWISADLLHIERQAQTILNRQITPPLSDKEGVSDVNVYDVIKTWLQEAQKDEYYQFVQLNPLQTPQQPLLVRINEEWLRHAVDILVDNAIKEAQHVDESRRSITINTRLVKNEIEIAITDQGRGIPEAIKDQIFNNKIKATEGLGMGLLMAQAIIEAYGGKIYPDESISLGATMVIRLPRKLSE
jgi:GAF domain-containing protein